MPAGGGSGEGGLAARGYNGPAQPGGNYGGTNVSGTGGGFLGDRSAINAAVLNPKNPSTSSGTVSKTYRIVVDPVTGVKKKVAVTKNPIVSTPTPTPPVYNYYGMDDYVNFGWENPKIQDRIPGDYSDYNGPIPGDQPGYGQWGRDWGGNGDFSGVGSGMGSDPGSPSGWSGSGKDQSQVPGGKDPSRLQSSSMMMAPAGDEQPMVSPGPIGPGGQPMGNRPPMGPGGQRPPGFQWGARDLALRHGMEQMMRRRQMANRGRGPHGGGQQGRDIRQLLMAAGGRRPDGGRLGRQVG